MSLLIVQSVMHKFMRLNLKTQHYVQMTLLLMQLVQWSLSHATTLGLAKYELSTGLYFLHRWGIHEARSDFFCQLIEDIKSCQNLIEVKASQSNKQPWSYGNLKLPLPQDLRTSEKWHIWFKISHYFWGGPADRRDVCKPCRMATLLSTPVTCAISSFKDL